MRHDQAVGISEVMLQRNTEVRSSITSRVERREGKRREEKRREEKRREEKRREEKRREEKRKNIVKKREEFSKTLGFLSGECLHDKETVRGSDEKRSTLAG